MKHPYWHSDRSGFCLQRAGFGCAPIRAAAAYGVAVADGGGGDVVGPRRRQKHNEKSQVESPAWGYRGNLMKNSPSRSTLRYSM